MGKYNDPQVHTSVCIISIGVKEKLEVGLVCLVKVDRHYRAWMEAISAVARPPVLRKTQLQASNRLGPCGVNGNGAGVSWCHGRWIWFGLYCELTMLSNYGHLYCVHSPNAMAKRTKRTILLLELVRHFRHWLKSRAINKWLVPRTLVETQASFIKIGPML